MRADAIVGIYTSKKKSQEHSPQEFNSLVYEPEYLECSVFLDLTEFLAHVNRTYFQGDYDGFTINLSARKWLIKEAEQMLPWFNCVYSSLLRGHMAMEVVFDDTVIELDNWDLISE